jgi:hypothetical protein
MTPAAPSRTTLAGLLLAGAWLGSAGVAAAAQNDAAGGGDADSTTTTVPPTTTTVPQTTSTTALQAILSGKSPAAVAWDSYQAERAKPPAPAEPAPLEGGMSSVEDPLVPEVGAAAPLLPGLLDAETGAVTAAALGGSGGALPVALPAAVPAAVPVPGTGAASGVTTGDGSVPASIPGPAAAAAAATPAPTPHGSGDVGPAPTLLSASAPPALPSGVTALNAASPDGTGVTGQAENPERGPPTTIATGDATSTGNKSSTTIEQTNLLVVTEEGPLSISTAYNPDTGLGRVNGTLPGGGAINAGVPDAVAGLRSNSLSSGGTGNGAARINTGDATATGNDSVTTINQTNLVVVLTDNTHLDLDQASEVDNLGTANAATGSNTATGGTADDDGSADNHTDGSAAIATGNATATGNHSKTVINQTNAVVVLGDDSSVNVNQRADVDNIGVANATTGDNSASGGGTGDSGSAIVTTGDATATGNVSTTIITQKNTAVITGDRSSVTAAQQADVTNRGTATARSGGNTAAGGTGEGEGEATVDTGDATATGNWSTTTLDQWGAAVTLGEDSWADLSQTTHVDNVGDATADSGNNSALGQAA